MVKKHFVEMRKKDDAEEKTTEIEERPKIIFKSEEEKRLEKRIAADKRTAKEKTDTEIEQNNNILYHNVTKNNIIGESEDDTVES